MVGPTISLSNLDRADGSASYTCPTTGYSVLGAVNAPVELPARRDALKPEEATVEVFVKPGNATAGVGERYVEGIIRSVLGKIILGREKGFPRRGVVITLAIIEGKSPERGDSVRTTWPFFKLRISCVNIHSISLFFRLFCTRLSLPCFRPQFPYP